MDNNYTFLEEDEDYIDIKEIALMLLGKAHYIIMFLLIGAVICNMYAYFTIKPTYTSKSRLYLVSASKDSVVDLTDLAIGTNLAADYVELLLNYPVLDKVSDRLEKNYGYRISSEGLQGVISLNNPEDTRLLDITVTTTDPEKSQRIANTVAEVAVEYIPDTMGTMKPNIAQEAKIAKVQSGPSYFKYTAMGAMLGALLCMAWFIFKHLSDDTIKTREDMEKYFGMAPLTVVPYEEASESEQ